MFVKNNFYVEFELILPFQNHLIIIKFNVFRKRKCLKHNTRVISSSPAMNNYAVTISSFMDVKLTAMIDGRKHCIQLSCRLGQKRLS